MSDEKELARQRIYEIARRTPPANDLGGFFETVYASADRQGTGIPWADMEPHPLALEWFQQHALAGAGRQALVVGCGLGDDAEELARRGFQVTAFDISPTAIAWCQQRFPASSVNYQVANLLAPPEDWRQTFDFVLEIYTVQAMPLALHESGIASIASLLAPGGQLLVICRAREVHEAGGPVRWPLTRAELAGFEQAGLRPVEFEDLEIEDGRHFRAVYER